MSPPEMTAFHAAATRQRFFGASWYEPVAVPTSPTISLVGVVASTSMR
jgi:hypothetical protein